jgi:hypothetical protein
MWAVVNITPEQAREKAIEEAKKDALRKAGVVERIKSSQTVSVIESNRESAELFSMFSSIEMNGAVTDWNIKKDRLEISKVDGQPYWMIIIDATVKKYATMPDPEFKIDVRGLRTNGYSNGEAITFSVIPNKAGYLKIFLFENINDAALLFPNNFEPNRKMKDNEAVKFPTVGIDYTAEKSTAEKQEHNLLMFVYTKNDIPFYGDVNCQRVMGWINGIEPNEREVVMRALLVTE